MNYICVWKRKIFIGKERGKRLRNNFIVTRFVYRTRLAAIRSSAGSRIKILAPRVSPRHNKYYFPKIATSPLRDIIPHRMRVRSRIYTAATVRSHLETGAPLCEKIHGVYRYLYARELAFHNQFPQATSTTTTSVGEPRRSISYSFIGTEPRELRFLCATLSALAAFPRSSHRAVCACTSALHSSFALQSDFCFHYVDVVDRIIGPNASLLLFICRKRKNKYRNEIWPQRTILLRTFVARTEKRRLSCKRDRT